MPVHNRYQIEEVPSERNVGDGGAPHAIGVVDGEAPQQVGVIGVFGVRRGGLLRVRQVVNTMRVIRRWKRLPFVTRPLRARTFTVMREPFSGCAR